MTDTNDYLERLWDRLLSRNPEQILQAFEELEVSERGLILAHLQRMVTEPDWHPEQQISAQAAVAALKNYKE